LRAAESHAVRKEQWPHRVKGMIALPGPTVERSSGGAKAQTAAKRSTISPLLIEPLSDASTSSGPQPISADGWPIHSSPIRSMIV
jgi:hypothetical protein